MIIFVFFVPTNPVCAQEADSVAISTAPYHGWLYHFLFDSTLASNVPVEIDSEHTDHLTYYVGGMVNIDLTPDSFAGEIVDTLCRANFVDIRCSDKAQYTEIERSANDTIEIRIYLRDPGTGGKKGQPIFDHIFDATHTSEIRLHLRGGDDYAIARGSVASSMTIAVVGGAGNDELVDSSRVSGHVLHILPLSKDQKKTFFYGDPGETNFIYSSSTVIDSKHTAIDDSSQFLPLTRDWGHAWHYHPLLGYTSDDGALIGAGVSLVHYVFRADPFQMLQSLRGYYATTSGRFKINYDAVFPHTFSGDASISVQASSDEVIRFFGYGNETVLSSEGYISDIYDAHIFSLSVAPKYEHAIFDKTIVWGSIAARYVQADANPARDTTFLKRRHTYGVGSITSMRLGYGILFDSRDEPRAATKGIYAAFESYWTPEVINNTFAYTTLRADIRAYLSANILTPMTFALRMRAEKILGEHPFYESNFLGGIDDLRGYYRNRYAGVASALGSAELRIDIAKCNIAVPGTFGALLFVDAGRVYVDNDFSNLWHTSFGGGLWVAPVSKVHTVSLTASHSSETTRFYLSTGFAF